MFLFFLFMFADCPGQLIPHAHAQERAGENEMTQRTKSLRHVVE